MRLLVHKKSLVALVVVLGVVILSLGLGVYSTVKPKSATALCNDRGEGSLLVKAKTVFDGGNATEKLDQYQTLADHAKSIDDFDQHPNCLYRNVSTEFDWGCIWCFCFLRAV